MNPDRSFLARPACDDFAPGNVIGRGVIRGVLPKMLEKCLFRNGLQLRAFREELVGPPQKCAHFP
jgi:hypothetical protein